MQMRIPARRETFNPSAQVAKKTGNYWPHTGPPGTGARGEKMPVLMAVMAKKRGPLTPTLSPDYRGEGANRGCSAARRDTGEREKTSYANANIEHSIPARRETLNVERKPAEAGTTNRTRTLIYAD